MKRARSESRYKADTPILAQIIMIKGDHPLWGYRRVWATIRYRQNIVVGKNRVYRLMKENRLLIMKKSRLLAKRSPIKPKPRASRPNQYWGTDMTKVKVGSFGWIYIHSHFNLKPMIGLMLMKTCSDLKIKQIFTTWNNPKGNADTERVMRTLKEDLIWPYDWQSPFELQPTFENWVNDYNTDFPHQSLGYKTPAQMMSLTQTQGVAMI